MKKQKEKPKEYESITTVKCDGKLIDLITLLTYTPFDGGKGLIITPWDMIKLNTNNKIWNIYRYSLYSTLLTFLIILALPDFNLVKGFFLLE